MRSAELGKSSGAGLASPAWDRALPFIFAATIGLSAFLLFAVQPLFARMVLPKLGGSPSVWAVAMCFFQTVLLAGYCYAHILNSRLAPARAVLVHLIVLATACLALPIVLPAAASTPPEGNTYLWLIGILAAGVGIPFFAVSANAPLLQSWFGRTGHPHAADPYFLYGASNFGSLAALLLYPVVAEPLFGLTMQSSLWTAGFLALGVSIAACGAVMLGRQDTAAAIPAVARPVAAAPTLRQRLLWIALSFVPSGLLVAFTTYLTTDIASAPFLWVLPLALFLATFILVFRDPPLVPMRALAVSVPIVATLAYIASIALAILPFWLVGLTSLTSFLAISLVCHRALYERRPGAEYLTEFYLWMSFGGVLGGMFAALAAPQLFTSIFEFPLLILAGVLIQPKLLSVARWRREWPLFARLVGVGLACLVALQVMSNLGLIDGGRRLGLVLALCGAAGVVLLRRRPIHQAAIVALVLATTILPVDKSGSSATVRSFFGVLRVQETAEGDMRYLVHGTTVHGAQRLKDADGKAIPRPIPASYYHAGGPMARSLALVQGKVGVEGKAGGERRVGIVGLGAGSMACYARPDETWRLYEIDPAVVEIARDPSKFNFLSHCLPKAPIILGDARLTLAAEPVKGFDYLLIDAFSSDSIPVHLMTVEGLRLYLSKLADDGLMALHISNRHLDLAPVLAAALPQLPGVSGVLVRNQQLGGNGIDAASSIVVLLTRNSDLLARALAWPDAQPLRPSGVDAWTDDYADILSALRRGNGKAK